MCLYSDVNTRVLKVSLINDSPDMLEILTFNGNCYSIVNNILYLENNNNNNNN